MEFRPDSSSSSNSLPFFLDHIHLIYDNQRQLIYAGYREYTLKNDSTINIILNVICIDPLLKRAEEYLYPSSTKPALRLDSGRGVLCVLPFQSAPVRIEFRRLEFGLIDVGKLNLETRSTVQLLVPPKNARRVINQSPRSWKSVLGDIAHHPFW